VEPAEVREQDLGLLRRALGVSTVSPDPTTKVGAVLANTEGIVIATGFNRFPRGITPDARLNDRPLKNEMVIHAEPNVILQGLELISKVGMYFCTLYITTLPCARCTGIILDANIGSVVCLEPTAEFLTRWKDSVELSRSLFEEAGVQLKEYSLEELDRDGKEQI